MLITADFSIIPSAYAKDAPEDARVDSVPCVSFPFYIDQLNPRAKYLHWEFSDPDSIPVCGFEWIHWTVANLPVEAIMFDPSDAHAWSKDSNRASGSTSCCTGSNAASPCATPAV